MTATRAGPVVALVAALDRADTIGATIGALRGLDRVDEVVVVDDGSTDGTASVAEAAGARVVRLPTNRGKGGAIEAGIEASPGAAVYLLVDADTGDSAAGADRLLDRVLDGEADLTVGVLPAAGGKGGFGAVKGLARWGIRQAAGLETTAPLSGQRAVRAEVLHECRPMAARFGLETAMSIDAASAGARIVEVDVDMTHRHTGRRLAGFRHRAGQGVDIVRALWPRLTTPGQRLGILALALVLALVVGGWTTAAAVPTGQALPRVDHVVVVAAPGLTWADLEHQPALARGAVAMANVNTPGRPTLAGQWATASAGGRVPGPKGAPAAQDPTHPFLVTEMVAARRGASGHHLPSLPGALGDAIHAAGRAVGVVSGGAPEPPAALLAADRAGNVDAGATTSALGPVAAAGAAGRLAAEGLALVVVDPVRATVGDTAVLVDAVRAGVPSSTLVVVVSPAVGGWHLQPFSLSGPGIDGRTVVPVSPTTRRAALVTMSDVAPTVLSALGIPIPPGMSGHALRVEPGAGDLGAFSRTDRDARLRARLFRTMSYVYAYPAAILVILCFVFWGRFRLRFPPRGSGWVSFLLLAVAAWPVSTFLSGLVPRLSALGAWAVAVYAGIDLALVLLARRLGHDRLGPLAVLLGVTVTVLCADLLTGGHLQIDTPFGSALHTTGRFGGIGNAPFAVLAGSTLLLAATHLRAAPRRAEAVWAVAMLFAFVAVVDAAPMLGDDVGGLLTLVPVFGLVWWLAAGHRLRVRTVLVGAGATLAVLAAATAVDLARPASARTHLGRFASDVIHGRGSAIDLIARRWAANVHTYVDPFQYALVAVVVLMLVGLAARRWTWLLPRGSVERAVVGGVLAVGLLGNVLNDSGSVVTAVQFTVLGPFLVFLGLDRLPDSDVAPGGAAGVAG